MKSGKRTDGKTNLQLVVFDLDDTLTESKMPIDSEMARLVGRLLERFEVAVISGAEFRQLKTQVLSNLSVSSHKLERLYIFPTCGASFYRYNTSRCEWEVVYEEMLTRLEKQKIFRALEYALWETGVSAPKQAHGSQIEDRGSQVTFSALGSKAPLLLKRCWDPSAARRKKIKKLLEKRIPKYEIRIGGTTSIDITKKGIDKAYGIRKMESKLGVQCHDMLFVGDALFPGGNDYPVKACGVECIAVRGPRETKDIIKNLLARTLT